MRDKSRTYSVCVPNSCSEARIRGGIRLPAAPSCPGAFCRSGIKLATSQLKMRVAKLPDKTSIDRLAPVCQCHTPTLNKTGNFPMASSVLSVRLSDQERTLLEAASSYARTNVSDFVRRKALEAAEIDMVERRIVTIPAKDWARFEAWAAAPPREITGLKDLAHRSPTWRK